MVQIVQVVARIPEFGENQCWCWDCLIDVLKSYIPQCNNANLILHGCSHLVNYGNFFIRHGFFEENIWMVHLENCDPNVNFDN